MTTSEFDSNKYVMMVNCCGKMYSYLWIHLFVYLDHRSSSISMVLIPIIEKHLVTALNSHQKGGGRVVLSRRKRGNVKNAAAFARWTLLFYWEVSGIHTYVLLVVVLEGEYHPNPHFLYFYVVVYTDTLCGRIPNKCLLLKIVCEII